MAIEWISKYLAVRKDNDSRLFPITQDGVQKMLYRLAANSGLKTTGNLRFHKIRAWLMSRLSRAGFNEFQIKFIIGHSIALQDKAYLNTLKEEITEKYPLIYNDYLNIVPKIASQEATKKLGDLETKIRILEKKYETTTYAFDCLVKAFQQRGLLAKDFTIEDMAHDQEERDKQAEEET